MAPKPAGGKKDAAAAKAAQKAQERKKAAEDAFAQADADGSGSVDAKELEFLLVGLLQREGVSFERHTVTEFVSAEFAKADTDGSGDVDFDEFIDYYNLLLDRISGGAMNEALELAKKATAKKLEEAAIAEDDGVFVALHTLLAMLRAPSVHAYTGLVLPFKLRDNSEYSTPNPEHGSSSHGLVLDLSRRAQRLLTPWGSFPIGYRLAFTGYQVRGAGCSRALAPHVRGHTPHVRGRAHRTCVSVRRQRALQCGASARFSAAPARASVRRQRALQCAPLHRPPYPAPVPVSVSTRARASVRVHSLARHRLRRTRAVARRRRRRPPRHRGR